MTQPPVILHSDMNNFYASVECLDNPSLRGKPVAVTGDPDARHGIILAKNYEAKKYGIATGEPLWMARQKCPDVIFTPPRYDRYIEFSQAASQIYYVMQSSNIQVLSAFKINRLFPSVSITFLYQ